MTTKVIIEGIEYNSIADAAKALNIKINTLHKRLRSIHFTEYRFASENRNTKEKVKDSHPRQRQINGSVLYQRIEGKYTIVSKRKEPVKWSESREEVEENL